MVQEFFAETEVQQRLREGPLGVHIDGFAALLVERGYARATGKEQLRLVADLSRWLTHRRLGACDLDEKRAGDFFRQRRRPRIHRGDAATLRALLVFLRGVGIVRPAIPLVDRSAVARVEREFGAYLTQERGLSDATLLNYLPVVRRFLSERFGTAQIRFDEIGPKDVTRFVSRHARDLSPGRAKLMVTALRSFLRLLHLRGETTVDLAWTVPTVKDWQLARLPRWIPADQVERILKCCDQRTVVGQRDYTILLLLARLGLRAGEIVGITLDDIDWEAGELVIRGKGGRLDRLPLPRDVGEALAAYLRHGRPRCSSRRVFIRAKAPRQGFANSAALTTLVERAIARAGLKPPSRGAHLLRHSLATEMLRKGASLAEIGEVLRHRRPDTTAIYAKVDLDALRAIAQPWPGGAR